MCYFENLWGEGEGIVVLGIILKKNHLGICILDFAFGLKKEVTNVSRN